MAKKQTAKGAKPKIPIPASAANTSVGLKASPLAWVLGITLALQPLALDLFVTDEYETPKLALLRCSVALVIAAWFFSFRKRPLPRTLWRAALPFGIFLVAIALSSLTSASPITSLLGEYGSNAGLQSQVCYVVMGCAALSLGRPQDRRLVLVLAMLGACLSTGMALVEASGHEIGTFFGMSAEIPAHTTSGTFGNPNYFAGYTVAIIPVAILLAFEERHIAMRILFALLAAASIFGVLYSGSRTGIAAIAISALWFVFFVLDPLFAKTSTGAHAEPAQDTRRDFGLDAATLRLAFVVVLALVLFIGGVFARHQLQRVGRSMLAPVQAFSADRLDLWAAAINMTADHPILGAGPDTYASQAQQYFRPSVYKRLGSRVTARRAHNEALNFLACTGIVGFSAWLLVFVGAFVVGMRACCRCARGSYQRSELLCLTSALAFGWLYNLWHFVTVGQAPWLFVLCGLLFAVSIKASADDKQTVLPRGLVYAGVALAAVLFVVVLRDGIAWIKADTHLKQSIVFSMRQQARRALDEAIAAQQLRPRERRYLEASAQLELALAQAQASSADKQAHLDAAQHAINRALELNRAPLTVWIAYHIAMARNQTENIRSLGREAIDRDPTRPGEVARVSSWLLARGYSDDAMTVLSRAGRNAPEDSAKLALDLAQRLIAGAQKHTADRRVVALKQAMQLVDLSDKLSLQPEHARPLRQRLEALEPASVQSATTSVSHPQVAPDSASTTNSVETVAQPSP